MPCPCAWCRAQPTWTELGASGLVIDHAVIEEAERRRRGEASGEAWWKRGLVWLSVGTTAILAVLAVWSAIALFSARPIGPLAALIADLMWASQRATLVGVLAVVSGVLAFRRLRRRRHFRWVPGIVAHGTAIVAGLASLALGVLHWTALAGGGRALHTSMPARTALDVPVQVERILNATVVVLAPDADGDARRLSMGTGAIVAADTHRAWILTCSHVAMPYASVGAFRHAREAQAVWVQLADGREGRATVRWAAPPPLDLVLVELPIEDAPEPARISVEGSDLPVGASVMFVPNPYRAGWMVHHGQLVQRRTHHTPAGVYDLLLTDLPVVHGDSGSGLFDAHGNLVGINTWTHVRADGPAQGISLPSTTMRALVEAIDRGELDALDDLIQPPMKE